MVAFWIDEEGEIWIEVTVGFADGANIGGCRTRRARDLTCSRHGTRLRKLIALYVIWSVCSYFLSLIGRWRCEVAIREAEGICEELHNK